MEREIKVTVKDKIAVAESKATYICGNSDFVITFDFDSEWDEFNIKTARFVFGGNHIDVVFEGNKCAVPIITNTHSFRIGVFAGDLRTTTPAYISAKKSILCDAGVPTAPSDDVYAQLIALIEGRVDEEVLRKAAEEYVDKNFVSYLEQNYAEEEKAQARKNIGAVETWDDLANKPFRRTAIGDTITWDGNTAGLDHDTWDGDPYYDGSWFRVCSLDDSLLDNIELLKNATFTQSDGAHSGFKEQKDELFFCNWNAVIIVPKDGAVWKSTLDLKFPRRGIYFSKTNGASAGVGTWTTSFTVPGYTFTKEELDRNLLPDTVVENGDSSFVLTSAAGQKYKITVTEDGVLETKLVAIGGMPVNE